MALFIKSGTCLFSKKKFVQLINKCTRTVKYRFKINGAYTDQIIPGRGLRQGDPISSYLFLLCAEGLSAPLQHEEITNQIRGIVVAEGAPAVSHLLFADDSLLLFEATPDSVQATNHILQVYELGSGQVINRDKSAVLFSKNTPRQLKAQLLSLLGLRSECLQEKYLGLLSYVGQSTQKCFEYLRDKIWEILKGWKIKLLSKAGKEILVKAVIQAVPTYAMSCFDLTKALCESISEMVCNFWWENQDEEERHH